MAWLRAAWKMASPKANPMKLRTLPLPLSLLLLALAAPVRGQSAPQGDAEPHRPLNLSLPRDAMRPPVVTFDAVAPSDPVERNLRPAQVSGGPERMPYGSGYEARQRGAAGRGDAAAPGTHGRSGGSGGSGRGGMGRGR